MNGRTLREGYLLVDHRNSPGVPEKGIDKNTVHEFKTLTCGHCQTIVILNPDRVRDRPWCFSCNDQIAEQIIKGDSAHG
jgi:hypothetical protein